MTHVFVASPERLGATQAEADAATKLLERLFEDAAQIEEAVRRFGTKLASVEVLAGFSERYWAPSGL